MSGVCTIATALDEEEFRFAGEIWTVHIAEQIEDMVVINLQKGNRSGAGGRLVPLPSFRLVLLTSLPRRGSSGK